MGLNTLSFISGEPALLAGKSLVISDLHIGIEHEYRQSGIKLPSQTWQMRKRLDSLLRKTRASSLLICGDLKHKVPGITLQEEKEIPAFLEHFLEKAAIEIAQGNHDADLRPLLPPKVKLHPTEGFLKGSLYLSHGHAWPAPSFLQASYLVIGHVQPQIEIRDRLGYVWREQVWVRAELDKKKVFEKYKAKAQKTPELVILPSFNPLAGGLALNALFSKKSAQKREATRSLRSLVTPSKSEAFSERLCPILKLARMDKAKIHLLDGTFLGELDRLRF